MKHVFVEYKGFAEKLYAVATEDDYASLQSELARNPEKGDLIRGLHGARKIRMGIRGRGKSGGARVIYYLSVGNRIWLLDIYVKSDKRDLSSEERVMLNRIIALLKGHEQ